VYLDACILPTSGLYYKHITIVNDNSTMMLQVVASPMIIILTNLEVSFMLLANIYSRGVTHDDRYILYKKRWNSDDLESRVRVETQLDPAQVKLSAQPQLERSLSDPGKVLLFFTVVSTFE